MKKSLLLLSIICASFLTSSAQLLEVLDVSITNDLNRSSTALSTNSSGARGGQPLCVPDTVQYALAKATGLAALNINNATSAQGFSQYFDAPQDITVSGVDFYAYKIDATGGISINVNVSVYLAGPDSLPSGAPLTTTAVVVDTAFGNGVLSVLQKSANFIIPVTVSQPYLIVIENNSSNNVGFICSDYNAVPADGLGEFLPSLNLFGTWTRSYNVNVGGNIFDADWLVEPYVSYDLQASYTQSGDCITSAGGAGTWTNTSSPVLFNRMYSQAEFFGVPEFQFTWNYGDGAAVENVVDGSHTYTPGSFPWDVTLTDTLFGWTTICVSDVVESAAVDAGTLTADATPVCLTGGTATISATEGTAPTVPAGYEVAYVLTDGDSPNLDILDVVLPPAAVASFDVTAEGNYIIHTLVFDPADGATILGETTGVGVATLIGTGAICASLDVAGTGLIVVESCGPANDECVGAVVLTQGATCVPTQGTLDGATESLPGCSAQNEANDVWFVFTATAESAVVDVVGSQDVDAVFEFYEAADCGSLPPNGICVDNGFSAGDPESEQFDNLTIGNTYYVRVHHWNGGAPTDPTFDICVYDALPPPPAPSNDDACSAEPLALGANGPFTNVGATVEGGTEVIPGGGTGVSGSCQSQDGWCSFSLTLENTIWFSFVAPASGNVIVSTDGSDFDTQLAVYSAVSCQDLVSGTAVLEGANDDNPDATVPLTSEVVLCGLTPGETYLVQVDGYDGEEGDATVTLTETTVDADFTYAATGLSVAFTDASSTSSTIVEWAWDFGDGNTSDIADPTNVYALDGPYTVCLTVTDENGCTSEYCEAIQVTDIPTTIAEAVERGMEVYPNPSNGQFVVEVSGVEADVQIVVLDVAGRQVYNEGVTLNNSFRKDLNLDVASGTYFLQVATLEGLVTRKIQIH